MRAQCGEIEYRKGFFGRVNGIKKYEKGRWSDGKFYVATGFGWGVCKESSKLVLHTLINGDVHEIWIDVFFREHLGNLTKKTRERIEDTAPDTVAVEKKTSLRGREYYVISETDLEAWLSRIQQAL